MGERAGCLALRASPFLLSTPLGPSLSEGASPPPPSAAVPTGSRRWVPDPAVALRRPVQDTVPTGAPATHASPSPSPTLHYTPRQRWRGGGGPSPPKPALTSLSLNLNLK